MSAVIDSLQLEPLRARWMTGGTARAAAPEAWSRAVEGVDEREADLRLLAFTGQALQIALLPAPDERLSHLPALPTLAFPTLEPALRPAFRRLIAAEKTGASVTLVVGLLASRGRVPHPFDWMPSAHAEGLPEVYAPWIDWAAGDVSAEAESELTEESWEDFTPARRVAAWRLLRRRDRAAAIALLASRLPGEEAGVRLSHLAALESDLDEDDLPLLEGFAQDRSQKVRALVESCRARLETGEPDPGALAALADFFRMAGFLGKRRLEPIPVSTRAKVARRTELLDSLPLSAWAEGFGLTPEGAVQAWRCEVDPGADAAVSRMIARTAPASLVTVFLRRLIEGKHFAPGTIEPMLVRLDGEQRTELIRAALEKSDLMLTTLADWAQLELGRQSADLIRRSAGWKAIEQAVREEKKAADARDEIGLRPWLFAAGLLAGHEAAAALLGRLRDLGLDPFDPRLAALQFNASLTPIPTP